MTSALRACHKYLGLVIGTLWLLEALTGAVLVFHREISDAELGARRAPTEFRRLDARIRQVAGEPGIAAVGPLTVSGGLPGYFDLYTTDHRGHIRVLRLDGRGQVLASMPWNYDFLRMSGFQLAYVFHTSLFAGPAGRLFLGASGILLVAALLVGVKLAWPPRGHWRRTLLPPRQRRPLLKWLTWHRASGLWLVIPAMVFITAGAVEGLIEPLDSLLSAAPDPPTLEGPVSASFAIPPSRAIAIAVARHAGSSFSVLDMPTARQPWYGVRVLEPGEPRRSFGTTLVYIGAIKGDVLADRDALQAPLATRVLADAYPLHTGEYFGLGGRILSLANGIWITIMACLGAKLWWTRRQQRVTKPLGAARQN